MEEKGLDELLDSVERDLKKIPSTRRAPAIMGRSSNLTREVDELLEDTAEGEALPSSPPPLGRRTAPSGRNEEKQKCLQVLLGGSLISLGCNTASKQR